MSETASLRYASLWVGKKLSWVEWMCLSSFHAAGQSFELFVYDSEIEVPQGIKVRDARTIVAEEEVFENPAKPGSYALFSNYFRYRLLQQTEMVWVDADIIFLRPPMPRNAFIVGLEEPGKVNNAVLSIPRNHEMLQFLVEQSKARIGRAHEGWGITGPRLLTEAIDKFSLWNVVAPADVYYPIHYYEVDKLFDPAAADLVSKKAMQASTIHLWNEYLRSAAASPKDFVPPPRSFIGQQLVRNKQEIALPEKDLSAEIFTAEWKRKRRRVRTRLRMMSLHVLGLLNALGARRLSRAIFRIRLLLGF